MTNLQDILEIQPLTKPPDCTIKVPGSKGITNRAVILAALAALAVLSLNCGRTAKDVDPRVKEFATLKRQQTEALAARLHLGVPSEVREFFEAAEHGDWIAVSNSFARIQKLSGNTASGIGMPCYTNVLSVPIHETRCAYDEFYRWDGALMRKFADGILRSLSAGSIYFAGMDPGRFVITAMRDVAKSPDIFIITQNALLDRQYVEYLRLTYGGRLWLPTETNVEAAVLEYAQSIEERRKVGQQPGPDEEVSVDAGGRPAIKGLKGVMTVNGTLAKMIFDNNKAQHEFFVEESYAIPWMYPYMEPHGPILRLNKEPVSQLDPAVVARDREFWATLSKDLLADSRFIGNEWARGCYAKLRSSIGALYAYRHMTNEAEVVYKHALELGPKCPEPAFRLSQLYLEMSRYDDAMAVMEQFRGRLAVGGLDWQRAGQAIAQIHTLKLNTEVTK
jgi:hypothetical protein